MFRNITGVSRTVKECLAYREAMRALINGSTEQKVRELASIAGLDADMGATQAICDFRRISNPAERPSESGKFSVNQLSNLRYEFGKLFGTPFRKADCYINLKHEFRVMSHAIGTVRPDGSLDVSPEAESFAWKHSGRWDHRPLGVSVLRKL